MVQNLAPDGIVSVTNVYDSNDAPATALTDLDESPDTADTLWWGSDVNLDATAHLRFPTPAAAISGTQTFRFWVKRRVSGRSDYLTAELYENGVLVRLLLKTVEITSNTGQLVTVSFDASVVTTPANVEVKLTLTATRRTMLGVNLGVIGSTAEFTRYEDWLSGRPLDKVNIFIGRADWTDATGGPGYFAGLYSGVPRERIWSTPLIVTGGTLAAAASGSYDANWTTLANNIVTNSYPSTGPIIIRLGWEMNLDDLQFPWKAIGQATNYINAWQRCVNLFRGISKRFIFNWCVSFVDSANIVQFWPGDSYVDIVGLDTYVYFGSGGFTGNPSGAITYYITGSQTTSLTSMKTFADAHGKPFSIDEWGVSQNGFETYINAFADFCTNNNILYTSWWEVQHGGGNPYDSFLNDESLPTTGHAFQKKFGYWTPQNLTGLLRFYDAKQTFRTTANATAVSAWDDLSENVNAAQGTGTAQPAKQTRNSHEEVRFDGTTDFMTIGASTLGTGATFMFVVANHNGTGNYSSVVDLGNAVAGAERTIGTDFSRNIMVSCNGAGNDHIGAAWGTGDRIIGWTLDPAVTAGESILYVDGDSGSTFNMTGTAINTTSATHRIGCRTDGTTFWPGGLQCAIICNAIPTTAERQALEGWAAWRFDLTSRLPSGHPNKSVRS